MDILTTIEPQLATFIPVVGVVLCALLVYIFGFQKTQEPSFQHLAVLQSTNKGSRTNSNSTKRSSTPQVKTSSAKASNKSVANGHANGSQASPKPNGTVKTANKVKEPSHNKENVRPQQQKAVKKEKAPRDATEDLDAGDWIQAPSRKDKKAKKETVTPKSPEKSKLRSNNNNSIDEVVKSAPQAEPEPQQQQQQPQEEKVQVSPKKDQVEPEVVPVPTEQPTPKKAKENKKKSPKVEKSSTPSVVVADEVKEPAVAVKEQVVVVAAKENAAPASPVKETPAPKNEEAKAVDPKNNIAFDEMGDAWEEAKSRGTKKRRARKD